MEWNAAKEITSSKKKREKTKWGREKWGKIRKVIMILQFELCARIVVVAAAAIVGIQTLKHFNCDNFSVHNELTD